MTEQRASLRGKSKALSPPALAALRTMVAWSIVGNPALRTSDLDREFGRDVWEELYRAKLLKGTMYECHRLTRKAVFVAAGWDE